MFRGWDSRPGYGPGGGFGNSGERMLATAKMEVEVARAEAALETGDARAIVVGWTCCRGTR